MVVIVIYIYDIYIYDIYIYIHMSQETHIPLSPPGSFLPWRMAATPPAPTTAATSEPGLVAGSEVGKDGKPWMPSGKHRKRWDFMGFNGILMVI